MPDKICVICTQKHHLHANDVIAHVLTYVHHVKPDKEHILAATKLQWDIYNHRCKYGLSCDILRNADRRLRQLQKELTPKMLFVMQNNPKLYKHLLWELSPEFPLFTKSITHYEQQVAHKTTKENKA